MPATAIAVLFLTIPATGGPLEAVGLQAALDRSGFSPGLIDGGPGAKTQAALEAFQRFKGLPATGQADAVTRAALGYDSQPAVTRYVISQVDAADVAPAPANWIAKSKVDRLRYTSLAALVAERGHCSRWLLGRLNPGMDLDRLKAGDALVIPNVASSLRPPRAMRLDIDFDARTIRVIDKAGRTAALFHCSIAKHKWKRPSGPCKVVVVRRDPDYLFDPKMWPEVKDVKRKLVIPPGPRSPVGLCWIGLSLDGFGIHGTPEPELIGKTGSHGCFRLTNWDALRLGEMVRAGTPVRFTETAAAVAARTPRSARSRPARR
ncbi:MAG TPA: L,D-transpeptidase [Phycisphaerae bacterium]|nr:L,D-transpeptidase [Phycisphaerae bacterium]